MAEVSNPSTGNSIDVKLGPDGKPLKKLSKSAIIILVLIALFLFPISIFLFPFFVSSIPFPSGGPMGLFGSGQASGYAPIIALL